VTNVGFSSGNSRNSPTPQEHPSAPGSEKKQNPPQSCRFASSPNTAPLRGMVKKK